MIEKLKVGDSVKINFEQYQSSLYKEHNFLDGLFSNFGTKSPMTSLIKPEITNGILNKSKNGEIGKITYLDDDLYVTITFNDNFSCEVLKTSVEKIK